MVVSFALNGYPVDLRTEGIVFSFRLYFGGLGLRINSNSSIPRAPLEPSCTWCPRLKA